MKIIKYLFNILPFLPQLAFATDEAAGASDVIHSNSPIVSLGFVFIMVAVLYILINHIRNKSNKKDGESK